MPIPEASPESESVPLPALANPPAPEIVPAKLLLAELNVVVNVPLLTLNVPPEPERAATDSLPATVSWPLLIVTLEAEFKRPAEPKAVVPLLTVMPPAPSTAFTVPPCSA